MLLAMIVTLMSVGPLAIAGKPPTSQPTTDDGTRYVLKGDQLTAGAHHLRHAELFAHDIGGLNVLVLEAIDKVQATAPDGGGYFIGVKANPPESPIGYPLKLFNHPLLSPPRKTSYCSGSTYTAFIETMNILFPDGLCIYCKPPSIPQRTAGATMDPERVDALRMQEKDGSRREDFVKMWGYWNADGPGTQYALVQYTKMGTEIKPECARPGDFANINWTNGGGHSVIFLGWVQDNSGNKSILYWASQPRTNGLGDQTSSITKIASIKFVRLTDPHALFLFDLKNKVNPKVAYDKIIW